MKKTASVTTLLIIRTFAKEKKFGVELGGRRAERVGGWQVLGPALALSFTSCMTPGGTFNLNIQVCLSVQWVRDSTNLSGRHGQHRMTYVEHLAQCPSGIGAH